MPPNKVKKVNAEVRRYRLLNLYLAGATERQIAETENISHSLVHRELKRVLEELAKRNVGNADKLRAVENERYNALLLRVWDDAMRGDREAILLSLKIMQYINQINGLIPDRPLISIEQQLNTLNYNESPVTFRIEAANDNSNENIPETTALQ